MSDNSNSRYIDQLFEQAESFANNHSLFPESESTQLEKFVPGLVSEKQCQKKLKQLGAMDIDEYIESVISPSESNQRRTAKSIIEEISTRIITEVELDSLYSCEAEIHHEASTKRIGFICQNRAHNNGAWGPEHHRIAAQKAREYKNRRIPIVTFIDTPGAEAGESANSDNQAHSISLLITEMVGITVPTLGIIWGAGYSGGAIPLAATNLLLSLKDGVFNTIQPQGLASIARKYNLSWQECAKYVGVSSYELKEDGIIDGIIDYSPEDTTTNTKQLIEVILQSINLIEEKTLELARRNPHLMEHYKHSTLRFLSPSKDLEKIQSEAGYLKESPSEYSSIFGMGFRYTRYLNLRRRIKSTRLENYGRLAEQTLPEGQLKARNRLEANKKFQSWIQSPEKIVYNDDVNKYWKQFWSKYEERDESRSSIGRFLFGEPKSNYLKAKQELCFSIGLYLFNRWKTDAMRNFEALGNYLEDYQQNRFLLRSEDILNAKAVAEFIQQSQVPLAINIRESLPHEQQQEISQQLKKKSTKGALKQTIIESLNTILIDKSISNTQSEEKPTVEIGRRILEETLSPFIKIYQDENSDINNPEATILDAVLHTELRYEFIQVCQNMRVFGQLYDNIIYGLHQVAKEANEERKLSQNSLKELVESALSQATQGDSYTQEAKDSFNYWLSYFIKSTQRGEFLKAVEEWKKLAFPRLSETLFVVISFIFEKLLGEYYAADQEGKSYSGYINPVSIGRRKDFWNRLTMAYHDLLIQQVLDSTKTQKKTSSHAIIDFAFDEFDEINASIMSCDPVSFPGFRNAIENALNKNIKPCGVITGIGTIKIGKRSQRVGALISNLDFQAGAFDMGSAEKFCKLMVECAKENLPIVCFVSSGGMQTKEGAGALFSMAVVNDRITRFIRDNNLPIVVFGFGDCTGGAQASFVTHPLVQTYYFSGTNMPFAGQIVVPSYLPSTCTLSNYLSTSSESMDGLVQHPFFPNLDPQLRSIDPDIPIAKFTVSDVLSNVLKGHVTASRMAPDTVTEKSIDQDKIYRPINKLLIHARGCTAVKLIRKAQDNNIPVVLIQSDPDMDSVPADMLIEQDKLVCIGGNTPDESYLNAKSVLRIAKHEGADSLHPGIGFLSESSQFAALCANHDINFIGPTVSAMETMGNKSNAISTAMGAEVPVVPGSHGILSSSANAASIAESIGYPVLLKAVHGGGGKGIQVVHSSDDIHSLYHQISTEAKAAFGNGDVYLEKYITALRHIEVQVLRDSNGNCKILGLRDCSVQRNNQKVFEESGSTMLPKQLEQDAYSFSQKLADAVKYVGAGTVEFIYDLHSDAIYFMEMNTRLQVEHPVTELVSGIDIVSEQFRIATGESIEKLSPKPKGYAIEVRVNAEKAILKNEQIEFTPTPGNITECVLPEKDYIELISMAANQKQVSPFYDSMIIQIICYGGTREDTIQKLRNYLDEVSIKGVCTNIPLLKRVLDDEQFNKGDYDTTYLPQFLARIDQEELIQEIEEAAGLNNNNLNISTLKIEGSDELKVLSPSTSIFYRSSSPTEPSFVNEGDIIDTDQTLCLMEAMKMFTPIKLKQFNQAGNVVYPETQKYKVTRILNTDGQQANQGDLLFVIKPVKAT